MYLVKPFALFAFITLSCLQSYDLLIAAQEKGKKYDYINEQGEYVIPPAFGNEGTF